MHCQLLILCAILFVANAFRFQTTKRPMTTGAKSFIAMPTLLIQSSQALDAAARESLLRDCSKAVASTLGKPEQYVMVSFKNVDGMIFGGSTDPAAFCHLASIGKIGPETNPKMSKVIAELLQKHLQGMSQTSLHATSQCDHPHPYPYLVVLHAVYVVLLDIQSTTQSPIHSVFRFVRLVSSISHFLQTTSTYRILINYSQIIIPCLYSMVLLLAKETE